MSFSTIHEFLCGAGVALIIYSRTFPEWLRTHAQERFLKSKETIALMNAKLENYKRLKAALTDIETEADQDGAFATSKEKLDFKLLC